MSDLQSRLKEIELERADRLFASKWWAGILYTPGLLALAVAVFSLARGVVSESTSVLILIATLFNLVSVPLDVFRKKILRQDEAIKLLQQQFGQAGCDGRQVPASDH
jgi:hypothetical protein